MTASDGIATRPTIAQGAGLALALLGLINLFNYMGRVLFSVLLEPIKAELGFSDARMGRLADRTNRVRVIAVSLALWSLATSACGLARSFIGLFAARMTVGVGEAGCVPSAHSLIGDLFPPERRAWAVSVFTGIGSLGSMIGLVVSAPLFAATFLVGDTGLAYGLLFLAFLVSGLGMGPSISCMQVVAGPHIRATAIAFMVFATSIISYGGAPALVGLISDLALAHGLATDAGASLRLALIVTLLPPLISGLFFQAALNRRRRIDSEL